MFTHLNAEMMTLRIDLLRKLHFALPQNLPAVQNIQGFEVRLLQANLHTLLDQVVLDVQVEVQVCYIGIDQSLHMLTEVVSGLQTVEKPAGKVLNLQCAGIEMRQDHQLVLPPHTSQSRVRQFDALLLVRLLCHVSYSRERSIVPTGSSYRERITKQRRYSSAESAIKRERQYPWKRVTYIE